MNMKYNAQCWATGKTDAEIKEEIARLDARYYKPYPWNGVENAHRTICLINALEEILKERACV